MNIFDKKTTYDNAGITSYRLYIRSGQRDYDLSDGIITCGIGQNCSGFVDNVVDAFDNDLDPNTIVPNNWFDNLVENAKEQGYQPVLEEALFDKAGNPCP